jgi:glutaredoxin
VPQLGNPKKAAQVYGRTSCPWTGRARRLLETERVEFEFIDLDAPASAMFSSWLVAETKQNTNPYIFLGGRFIGGYNALDEIVRLGQLEFQVLSAEARAKQSSRVRVEVLPRMDHDKRPPGEND